MNEFKQAYRQQLATAIPFIAAFTITRIAVKAFARRLGVK